MEKSIYLLSFFLKTMTSERISETNKRHIKKTFKWQEVYKQD